MNEIKQHRNFVMINNNKLYKIFLHSHYPNIKTQKLDLEASLIKDITDFYNISIILYDNNNLKIIDNNIIDVNTDALNGYNLRDVFVSNDGPDLELMSTVTNVNDDMNCIKYIINFDYHVPNAIDPLYDATVDDDINEIKLNDNLYNCPDKIIKDVLIFMDECENISADPQIDFTDGIKCYTQFGTEMTISPKKLNENNIDGKNIRNIWTLPYNLMLYTNTMNEEDEGDYYVNFSEDFDLELDDYSIGDHSLGNEEYDDEYVQFVQLYDGTIYLCDFFGKQFVLDKLGVFNKGITIIELHDRPNYSVLLVDKMNIYEYNINKGIKLLMKNMNIDWFGSYKINKLQFEQSMVFTYNDDIKKLYELLIICNKFTEFKRITKYVVIKIMTIVYNDMFI